MAAQPTLTPLASCYALVETPLTRRLQINNARSKFKLDERIPEVAQESKEKLDGLRQDARDKVNNAVDQVDRSVEQKAADAKGTVSGWLGGKK